MTTGTRWMRLSLLLLPLAVMSGCADHNPCEGRAELWGDRVLTETGAYRVQSHQMMLGEDPYQQAFLFWTANTDEPVWPSGSITYTADDTSARTLSLTLSGGAGTRASTDRPYLFAGTWTVVLDLDFPDGSKDTVRYCHFEAESGGSTTPPSDVR